MRKQLTVIGNSVGLIIDKPMLEMLRTSVGDWDSSMRRISLPTGVET